MISLKPSILVMFALDLYKCPDLVRTPMYDLKHKNLFQLVIQPFTFSHFDLKDPVAGVNILPNARILHPGTIIVPQGRIMACTSHNSVFVKLLLQNSTFPGNVLRFCQLLFPYIKHREKFSDNSSLSFLSCSECTNFSCIE